MNEKLVKFGSIFKHNEKDYVYLAHTDEILYSALILDIPLSETLKKRFENLQKYKSSPEISRLLNNITYCFVELRTEEVKSRLAHFAKTDENSPSECLPMRAIGQLNKEDLKEIKKEIEIGPVPLRLRELTKDIVIDS